VFCAAVCPLGAAQDIVLLKPLKTPGWLAHALGLIPWIYLGAAVLFAATGSAFLICRYDPFVAFFRLSGSTTMLIVGGVMLLISVFIGRPYCRFLCPYGALLRLVSPLAKWRVTITPDDCVQCRLCEDACPFGEIRHPTPKDAPIKRTEGKTRLAVLLALLPVFVAIGAGLGRVSSGMLSRVDPTVRTARMVWFEEKGSARGLTKETEAFWKHNRPTAELYSEAAAIGKKFRVGGVYFGGWIGLVIGLKLIGLSIRRRRADYEADSAGCVACGRCYWSCPVERVRHGDPEAKRILEELRDQE
jgi:polyferredoxin